MFLPAAAPVNGYGRALHPHGFWPAMPPQDRTQTGSGVARGSRHASGPFSYYNVRTPVGRFQSAGVGLPPDPGGEVLSSPPRNRHVVLVGEQVPAVRADFDNGTKLQTLIEHWNGTTLEACPPAPACKVPKRAQSLTCWFACGSGRVAGSIAGL